MSNRFSFNMLRRSFLVLAIILFAGNAHNIQAQDTLRLSIETNEYWWGGLSADGAHMPYSASTNLERNLLGHNYYNQAQPLLISSQGRYIWSEKPIHYRFKSGELTVTSRQGKITLGRGNHSLAGAYNKAKEQFFPPRGEHPHQLMFTAPQYNTWIELMYNQNQADILAYAKHIIDSGNPPGVIMIDDNWQQDYGVWKFSAKRFSDPKKMIDRLHDMGFKVLLWVVPFVSPDSRTYRALADKKLLLANQSGEPAMIRWWNGVSAVLDLSNPQARDWFKDQLDHLTEEYNVDGFKFDAGDARFYNGDYQSYKPSLPNDHTTYFAQIGLDYPLNEYRASWKMAGYPLAQRLRDKSHNWGDLQTLIPDIIAQGLMGYAFTCPDMIGGGQFKSFLDDATIDQELIVRSAQVHALMPMMQFSVAPWRVLSDQNQKIVNHMARLHSEMGEQIMELVRHSAQTGEPIVRAMAYEYPDAGYAMVKDQFMLGSEIMVTPVVQKDQRTRKVQIPKGRWTADNGEKFTGPATVQIDVPLSRLPWFKKDG